MKERKTFLDYLSDILGWTLGVAMFIYLGYRTLHFLQWTFDEQDIILSILGLFSTTIGAVIFAVIWKRSFYFDHRAKVWRSDEFRKTVSLVMMIVCALGEAVLAFADIWLVTSQKAFAEQNLEFQMTEGSLNTYIWITVGLAFLVGAAIASIKLTPRHPNTDPEVDMSLLDMNNNGVLDSQERNRNNNQNRNQNNQNNPQPQPQPKPHWEAPQLWGRLRMSEADAKALADGKDVNQFYNALKERGIEKVSISRENFNDIYKAMQNGRVVNPQ